MNQIYYSMKGNDLIEQKMNIQVKGQDHSPDVNPAAHMSREAYRKMKQQNHLNSVKEGIKDCYTPDMVKHI